MAWNPPNELPPHTEATLAKAQYLLRDKGFTEAEIAAVFRREADRNRLALLANPEAQLVSPHFLPAFVEAYLNPHAPPPPPDLHPVWVDRLRHSLPACNPAHRSTAFVWDSYQRLCDVFAAFNINDLTHHAVRQCHLAGRCARDLVHEIQSAMSSQQSAVNDEQLAGDSADGSVLTVDCSLLTAEGFPPLNVAHLLSHAAKKLWQLRTGAQLMSEHALNPQLKTALLSAAQTLNRAESRLNRWLLVHRLAPWCMAPNGELMAPEPSAPTPPNGAETIPIGEAQTPEPQAVTAKSRHVITDTVGSEQRTVDSEPPLENAEHTQETTPKPIVRTTPDTLRTPPDGPRLNNQPPNPHETWFWAL